MVDVLKTSSQLSSFLRLTDYVDSDKLVHLSAEDLQKIVCGSDGNYLEHIARISGSRIQFVSNPIPGFQVLAVDQKSFRSGCAEGLRIVHAIRSAALKAAAAQSEHVVDPPMSSPDGLLPTPKARKAKYSPKSYHPLFSDPMTAYYPVMMVVPEGLLPMPMESESSLPPMSPELCMQIIKSPYLSVARRRNTMEGGIEKLKQHAKLRIAPQSPESKPTCVDSEESMPEETLLPPAAVRSTAFDDEIADCLPGVPGARQSKEYKKLRRKISEIDDLVRMNAELDYCQRAKVDRRPKYMEMIRALLRGEVAENCDDDEQEVPDMTPQETEDEQVTVTSTPQEPITPEFTLFVAPKKKQKKNRQKKTRTINEATPKQPEQLAVVSVSQNEITRTVPKSSFMIVYEFFYMLISWIARSFSIQS